MPGSSTRGPRRGLAALARSGAVATTARRWERQGAWSSESKVGRVGTATMTAHGGDTFVTRWKMPIATRQPAHIHEGTCDDLTAEPSERPADVVCSAAGSHVVDVVAVLIASATVPRWWAHRIGDHVDGSITQGCSSASSSDSCSRASRWSCHLVMRRGRREILHRRCRSTVLAIAEPHDDSSTSSRPAA